MPRAARHSLLPTTPSIDEARQRRRLPANDAAEKWGLSKGQANRLCRLNLIPGAVFRLGKWWVTPQGMDEYFTDKKR